MPDFAAPFRRAAKVAGLWQSLKLYVRAADETFGRPMPGTFDYTETLPGSLRWRDVDEVSKIAGGEVGDGLASLVGLTGALPDLLQTAAGDWLVVKGAAGKDALGVATKVSVRRWKEAAAPVIRNP